MTSGAAGLARRWVPALVTVFLFFVPQLSALGSVRNRYFLFWGPGDTLAICASVLVLSAAAVLLSGLLIKSGLRWRYVVRDGLFLLILGIGLLLNLIGLLHVQPLSDLLHHDRTLTAAGLACAFGLSLLAWITVVARWRTGAVRLARATCFIITPLFITVLGPALFWERWDEPPDPIPASTAGGRDGTPIYFLVFDEWSRDRSTAGDDFLQDLPHLRALRSQSYFFTEALSPGRDTYESLPELVFQNHAFESLPRVFVREAADGADDKPREFVTGGPEQSHGMRSLFGDVDRDGYVTYMLGFYLPYHAILGDQAAVVRAYSDYPKGSSFAGKMAIVTLQSPEFWRAPLLSGAWKRLYAPVFSRNWVWLNQQLIGDLLQVIDTAPRRSLVFAHLPVPHAPFVFNADGSYRGPFPIRSGSMADVDDDVMAGTPEDYHRSLRHLDTVVDAIVTHLKERGVFDSSLLIVTSDHSWREDPLESEPGARDRVRHIPLLVKLPGQTVPHTMDRPMTALELRPLIDAADHGGLTQESGAALLAHGSARAGG